MFLDFWYEIYRPFYCNITYYIFLKILKLCTADGTPRPKHTMLTKINLNKNTRVF